MVKVINLTLIIILVLQIFFSFFYSSNIITQNNQLYENQQQYQELKIKQQILEKQFTDLTSLYFLDRLEDSQQLIFLKNKINIQ